jgi:DNA-binding beta-propeller fold protein YncE
VIGALLAFAAPAFGTTPGALVQLSGTAGCLSSQPPVQDTNGCGTGQTFGPDGSAIAASPDGQNVYVTRSEVTADANYEVGAVLVFSRQAGGALTQLAGNDGCFSNGAPGCGAGRALGGAKDIVVSPDGKNVYVAASGANAIAVLDRHPDGTLTQNVDAGGCVSQDGTDNDVGGPADSCGDVRGLDGVRALAMSSDGTSLYAIGGSESTNSVAVFKRDANGFLTQADDASGCVSNDGTDGDGGSTCATARPMYEPTDVVVSKDGNNVYVSVSEGRLPIGWEGVRQSATRQFLNGDHGPGAIVVFKRNAGDGSLTQPGDATGCLTRDGGWDDTQKETRNHTCTEATGLEDAIQIGMSPDDKNVYVVSQGGGPIDDHPGALTAFARDGEGALAPLPGTAACVTANGTDGTEHYEVAQPDPANVGVCQTANGMHEPSGIAFSADGKNLYTMNEDDSAVAAFLRDGATGSVQQLPGTDGCISDATQPLDFTARLTAPGLCAQGRAMWEVTKMAVVGCMAYTVSVDSEAVNAFSRCNPTSSVAPPSCMKAASGSVTASVAEANGGLGAKTLHFKVDGGDEQTQATSDGATGTAAIAFATGRHTLEFWGEDENHRVEADHHTVAVVVDGVAPTVGIAGNAEYTRGAAATVTVTATDAGGSGIATDPSAANVAIPTDTLGEHAIERTAVDGCGNSATTTFRYRVVDQAVLAQSVPKACISRRMIPMQLARKALKGAKVKSVSAKLVGTGRTLKVTRKGLRIRATADLRQLPKGRFTVAITVKLSDGRTLTGKRTYRTCDRKLAGGIPKL